MTLKPTQQEVQPLKTRHVFFDTEVYRRAGFNLRNSQFKAFAGYVETGLLSLHTTDITLAEVKRQIGEKVSENVDKLTKIGKDFDRTSQFASDFPKLPDLDVVKLRHSMWRGFLDILFGELTANRILATEVPSRKIFERYFAGAEPFAKRDSKEFPDAFIVEALSAYCMINQVTMYVVSRDQPLRDAAASYASLIPLVSIDELLASSAAEANIDLEPLANAIFSNPTFDDQLTETLNDESGYLEGLYFGDLYDGSVRAIFVDEIQPVDGYSLAAIDDEHVSLILEVPCVLRASIDYLYVDLDIDESDGEYVTTANESVSKRAHLKLYVRIEKSTGQFKEKELLTKRVIFE